MKFREIFRFELACQLRRVSTWLCFALLFLFAFWTMASSRPTDGDVLQNAPFGIAFFTVLGGVIWLLIAPSVAGEAAARDVRTRMHPLTYTAPVGKAELLGGRFLAAFAVNALMLLGVQAGLLLGLYLPDVDASLLGPFRPAAYLTAYGLIALPFAFTATAIQFSWAALSRRPMASYLASVLLLIACTFVLMAAAQLLGRWELVRLLDLVGLGGIVFSLADTWTAAEQNTRLVGLEPTHLANRLIWLAVAGTVLAFTCLRFRLAHPAESTGRSLVRWRRDAKPRDPHAAGPAGAEIARSAPVSVPRVRRTFGFAMHARQALGIARVSFRAIVAGRGGLVLLAVIPALVVLDLPQKLERFGVPLLPRTEYVLTFLAAPLTDPLTHWIVIPLLIAYYAGELVWRERDAGLGDITDAAPVPEWALLLGKFLGLGLVVAAWMALLVAAGVLVQLRMGYGEPEIGLYLRVVLGLRLAEYLLFAALALVLHAVVNQKYAGHLAALVALGFIGFASRLGIEHNLLVYGAGPRWSYTDLRGFGATLGPWLWFKLYWAAWALLLAVIATLLWSRGREAGLGARLRTARRRFTRPTAAAAAVALALVLGLGGFVFYNTNVRNEYRSAAARAADAAEYERRYGRYAGIAQPALDAMNLRVEIYPERRAVEIRGTYRLVNRGAVPIDSIHLATGADAETGPITFDRAAARVLADEDLDHRIYALERPLRPGDSLRLRFHVRVEPRGFRHGGADGSVAANGTHFTNEWLPAIGYQRGRELRDAGARRAHGLAPRPLFAPLGDARAADDKHQRFAFHAVVGTAGDQVAVAPGALRRTWTERGRRYFHYAADAPIGYPAFFSAKYAVREARWSPPGGGGQPVAIRIHHHPGHTANLDRMLRSVRASLDHYSRWFGPYPYGHLTLVEAPGHGGMHAHVSLITFQEGFSLFDVEGHPRSPDFPTSVVAHEVAHQWWGIQLTPAPVEGATLLSEALAEYSAFQILEKTHGREHLRRYLGHLRTQYDAPGRRTALPLLRANGDFVGYYRGPFAMHTLGEYIGDARVNEALRRLLARHRSGAPPLPTTLDLYRELRAVTPDSLRYLLGDLFERNTRWEMATEQASAREADAGAWRVTLRVRARKVTVDAAGAETEVPMDDWVQVGVFAPAGEGGGSGEPLYLRMHRVRSGEQAITVTVPRRPARAGIDPHHLLMDPERSNNVRKVDEAAPAPRVGGRARPGQ